MSHFTVMVVGDPDNVEEQLIPFQEHACTGACPKEYMEFEDVEDEERKNYETGTTKEFYDNSSSSWGMVLRTNAFEPLKNAKVGNHVVLMIRNGDIDSMGYFERGNTYKCGLAKSDGKCPDTYVWVRVIDIVDNDGHPNPGVAFTGDILVEVINPPKEIPLKSRYFTFEDYMTQYAGYKERDPEKNRYGRWENPNKKWDWWQVGGRWAGFLLIKPEFTSIYASESPNFSYGWDEKSKDKILSECRVDSAKKGHVDWEKMMSIAEESAAKRYDFVMKNIFKDIPPNKLWVEFDREKDNARDEYWAQPRCVAWKAFEKKQWEDRKKNPDAEQVIGFYDSPDQFNCTREQFIQEARRQAIHTFAFLRNGKWAEKGEMGWWACVSNENDSWPEVFYKLLQDIPDDETVTIVDCHI